MSPHPATPPPHAHARGLWPSPQFSDYFSDTGDAASPANANQRKVSNPIQARIIGRLEAIARKVATQDHDGTQTPHLLDFDTELSALESRLNAPDSQTREIAEDGSSGLFADDDDPAVLQAENKDLQRQVQEGQDTIERISKVREYLQHRLDEIKTTSQLATDHLDAANAQISDLRAENKRLETENESIHNHNQQLHNDLRTAIPTISRLKSQLDAIEQQSLSHMESSARHELEEEIKQLRHEWEDVERDFEDMGRRYKKSVSRADSAVGNGAHTPDSDDRSGSPDTLHRSRIIIRRGGLIRRIDADPSPNEDSDSQAVDEELQSDQQEEQAETNGHDVEHETIDVDETTQTDVVDDEAINDKSKGRKAEKSPWQELWDSLAEYAGMHNHYDEDEDED